MSINNETYKFLLYLINRKYNNILNNEKKEYCIIYLIIFFISKAFGFNGTYDLSKSLKNVFKKIINLE